MRVFFGGGGVVLVDYPVFNLYMLRLNDVESTAINILLLAKIFSDVSEILKDDKRGYWISFKMEFVEIFHTFHYIQLL